MIFFFQESVQYPVGTQTLNFSYNPLSQRGTNDLSFNLIYKLHVLGEDFMAK